MPYALLFFCLLCLSPISAQTPEDQPPSVALSDLTYVRTALPYQGKQRLKAVMLLYNTYEWNLDRHFQLGVGVGGPLGILLNQRFRTSLNDWLHIGLSNELILAPQYGSEGDRFPRVGDVTTLLTVGSDQQFFSLGAGLFYASGSDNSSVTNYRIGAGTLVGERTHIYGELLAYLNRWGELGVAPSLNVAIANRRHRWSWGVMTVVIDGESYFGRPIPYISYSLYY
ncbi:hypothetical protein GGR28_001109 [Lewinella aquimaris]|uniref:Uncharacterized protein n=1 Tax=Neolewinella aquimaris TaxID=1835722 RepID=A0A840EBZ2_9BACT|nr:hypothetical protein [Neolewinella aquimaris]MBB4078496.1 hypothetical protein [Neolewinella aquimaris]